MSNKYFTTEQKDGKTWIINHTACHIDGEFFEYEQANQIDADLICELLNDLQQKSITLQDVMEIIHNIKYSEWKLEDLLDYVYGKASMDDLWARYDDIAKAIKEMV